MGDAVLDGLYERFANLTPILEAYRPWALGAVLADSGLFNSETMFITASIARPCRSLVNIPVIGARPKAQDGGEVSYLRQ